MGNFLSFAAPEEPPSVVLCPPLIDSRNRGRSRFAKSSYNYAFGQQQLRILFNDFLPYDTRGTLRFSPPEDPRISVVTKLRNPRPIAPAAETEKKERAPSIPEGKMTLRYQPDPAVPWTFLDIKAKANEGGSAAAVRACLFAPSANAALFAVLPLISDIKADGAVTASNIQIGARYTTPSLTAGAIVAPATGELHAAWAVARAGGLIFGAQTEPRAALGDPTALLSGDRAAWGAAAATAREALSWGVAYRPEGQSAYGRGVFTAAVELRRRRELAVSFLHHMATQRNVVNPLEKSDVVGITNYLDLAFQMTTDLSGSGAPPSMRLGAAWQLNKNIQIKGRLGLDGAAAGLVTKAWWHPALMVGVAAAKPFNASLRLGLTVSLESWSNLRYERGGVGTALAGPRVTQRHVASEDDVAYHEGQGMLVPLSEVENPDVLGQREPPGSNHL